MNLPPNPVRERGHALVIGGSMVGCLAAEVLSASFERVTLVEKTDFDDLSQERRSVPQEKHVHLLLLRGKQIMEEIFPGLLLELEQGGALVADLGHDVKTYHYGRWKQRFPTGISAHYCSRRLIDNTIRGRIRRNGRVTVLSEHRVVALGIEQAQGEPIVTGATLEGPGGSQTTAADLVIDASGRGSRMSDWLQKAGLGETPRTLVETRLGYASRIYRRRPEFANRWKVLLVLPRPPQQRRMGVISPIEGDRWLVTTGGWFGECPPPQAEAFLDFLATLPVPDIHEVIRDAEPLSDVAGFSIPGSLWRHYERVRPWPQGLLVMGDALCSMNPLYSQGMTLCALEAKVLREQIPGWRAGARRMHDIQASLSEVVKTAWGMATSEDLRFPETAGERTLGLRLRHWYGAQLAQQAAQHRLTLQTLVGVTNLVVPHTQLYRPAIAGRAIGDALRSKLVSAVKDESETDAR